MPVTLESRVRQMQVFNLPHYAYCKDGCACSDTMVVVVAQNPRTGERAPRHVVRKTPTSMTLLARERRSGLPVRILEVPEVKAAITRRLVRVVEQTPDHPASTAAVGASDFTQGEIPWRTDFGSLLHLLRHQKNDRVLEELGRVYVVDALKRWEPRVIVTSVQVAREEHDGENVLAIRLRYNLISSNVPGNNVVLSGIEQTVFM
jgi:phage baseplate assembly protein W